MLMSAYGVFFYYKLSNLGICIGVVCGMGPQFKHTRGFHAVLRSIAELVRFRKAPAPDPAPWV